MLRHLALRRRRSTALLLAALLLGLPACGAGQHLFAPLEDAALRTPTPEDSVVHIFYADPDSPNERRAAGTGFVLSHDGIIASAAHVVESAGLIDVKFARLDGSDGIYLPARVITFDRERDVALLKIDPPGEIVMLRPVRLARQTPNLGHGVAIYGFPESEIVGQQMRRSSGTVSSLRNNPLDARDKHTRMIELEAKIEPGNSGSPVFNEDNDVVGVVSSRWKTTDSYALAAPAEVVLELLDQRWPADFAQITADIRERPANLESRVRTARQLALAMRAIFPPSSEADRRVAQLDYCMDRASRELELAALDLDNDRYADAWRHVQLVQYELGSHEQDIAFLRSALRALKAQQALR